MTQGEAASKTCSVVASSNDAVSCKIGMQRWTVSHQFPGLYEVALPVKGNPRDLGSCLVRRGGRVQS